MCFRERLKRVLLSQHLRLEELSQQIDVSFVRLKQCIESSDILSSVEVLVRVARYLGVTVEYLATGEEIGNKYSNYIKVLDDLMTLPPEIMESIQVMIHAASQAELQKKEIIVSLG